MKRITTILDPEIEQRAMKRYEPSGIKSRWQSIEKESSPYKGGP